MTKTFNITAKLFRILIIIPMSSNKAKKILNIEKNNKVFKKHHESVKVIFFKCNVYW